MVIKLNYQRVILSLILASAMFAGETGAVTLVAGGEPQATIVVGVGQGSEITAAAAELQQYIEQMTGAVLPMLTDEDTLSGTQVLVGPSSATDALGVYVPQTYPQGEEFVVKTVGDNLVLMGNDAKTFCGTTYAVYDFLQDQLGVKWYFPGELGTIVPSYTDIDIGVLDISEVPAYAVRGISIPPYTPDPDRWRGHVDWAKHNKGPGLLTCTIHNYKYLFPPAAYYASHPEYYYVEGGGVPDDVGGNWQLQVQDQGLRDATAVKAFEYFTQSPTAYYNFLSTRMWGKPVSMIIEDIGPDAVPTMFSLSGNDNPYFCETTACQAYGNTSRRLLDYAIDVYSQIETTQPDALVSFYVYWTTHPAPVPELPKANEHITPVLCTGYFCPIHRVDDPTCTRNPAWLTNFHGWEQSVESLFFYYYDNATEFREMTYIGLDALQAFCDLMAGSSVVTGLNLVGTSDFGPQGVRSAMVAEFLWEGHINTTDFLRKYCQDLYGGAWEAVYDYMIAWDSAVANCGLHANAWGMPDPVDVFTPVLEEQWEQHRHQAEELYDSQDTITRQRLDRQFLQWKYDRITLYMLRAKRDYENLPNPLTEYRLAALIEEWEQVKQQADDAWLISKKELESFYPLVLPEVEKVCPGSRLDADFNCNGYVDAMDLQDFASQWLLTD